MARFLKKESDKLGTAPGALIFVGNKKTEKITIRGIVYGPDYCEIYDRLEVDELPSLLKENTVAWFDVIGLHETEVIGKLGDLFDLHPLLLEDILNTDQRTKIEEYESNISFILKMLNLNEGDGVVHTEQVSIVAGKNYCLCFQEAPGDVFENIRQRIIHQTTKIRHRGSDYLAFAMMDAIVDNYIVSIEHFGTEIENLEQEMLHEINPQHLERIISFKKEINALRRFVRPVLEIAYQYEKSESSLISKKTIPFIKDLIDHVTQAAEAVEIYKELLNDELSIYHNTMSNRLNDTIRVLTVFSVIFIPLSFLAGVYGTNFEHFPELGYKYAYPIFWGVLITIASGMLYFFHRKKWL